MANEPKVVTVISIDQEDDEEKAQRKDRKSQTPGNFTPPLRRFFLPKRDSEYL